MPGSASIWYPGYVPGTPTGIFDASVVAYTTPYTGAAARILSLKLGETVSVKDFGAIGDGVTDDTAAWNAAVNANPSPAGVAVYAPKGVYKITGAIVRTTGGSVVIYGDGMGITQFSKTGDSDLFQINIPAGGDGVVYMQGMTIYPQAYMPSGAAINILGNIHLPSCVFKEVYIEAGVLDFAAGFKLNNCAEPRFENCFVYTSKPNSTMIGWDFSSTRGSPVCGPIKFSGCSTYGVGTGIRGLQTVAAGTAGGLEGFQFVNCDFVCTNGISLINTGLYSPPQTTITGGHFSCSGINFYAESFSQITVSNTLFYNSGAAGVGKMIQFKNVNAYTINAQFYAQGTGDPTPIDLTLTPGCQNGNINHCFFQLGAAAYAIELGTASDDVTIDANRRTGGSGMVNGTTSYKTIIKNNYPLDAKDLNNNIAGAATLDIRGLRSDFINVTSGGAISLSQIIPRENNQDLTLLPNDANLTLVNGTFIKTKTGANIALTSGIAVRLKFVSNVLCYQV